MPGARTCWRFTKRRCGTTADNFSLKVQLTEVLLDQATSGDESKLTGDEGATAWGERLRKLGRADGYIQYFEGRAAMAGQAWGEASSRLESARGLLASDLAILPRINLCLGECYGRLGEQPKRLAAITRAADDPTAAPVAGPLLAEAMESQGRIDEAIQKHLYLVGRRPESHLDLLRLLIRKTRGQPPADRSWAALEQRLVAAEKALPRAKRELTLSRVGLLAAEAKYDQARATLQDAIAREPRRVPIVRPWPV